MGIQLVLLLILYVAAVLVDCNQEGNILYAQRKAWVDPNEVIATWELTGRPMNPCVWLCVTCNDNDSVIRLDLGNKGLSGTLLPQLGELQNLQYLELFGNNLTGEIPRAFGNLTSLVSMNLYQNQLTGSIPSTLGKLKALKTLRLNSNKLGGDIPIEVLDLQVTGNLTLLNVSDNLLAGTTNVASSNLSSAWTVSCQVVVGWIVMNLVMFKSFQALNI